MVDNQVRLQSRTHWHQPLHLPHLRVTLRWPPRLPMPRIAWYWRDTVCEEQKVGLAKVLPILCLLISKLCLVLLDLAEQDRANAPLAAISEQILGHRGSAVRLTYYELSGLGPSLGHAGVRISLPAGCLLLASYRLIEHIA